MIKAISIDTDKNRYNNNYELSDILNQSITIGDLFKILEKYPKDTEIFIRCDNQFGAIKFSDITENHIENEKEN